MSSPPSISPRESNLRLVVKGGGDSYQGTSNAADSLLIWTRRMNAFTLHGAFIGAGCEGQHRPEQAVTVEAGAIWRQVYDAVTTKGGCYVQGGGCMTVGVAGRRCAVRGGSPLGRVAACQQGPCRRACRSNRRGRQAHGDEPGGSGRFRADHLRGRGPVGVSRHSRSRARSVDRSQT
jgi:hypothetical protein